MIVTIDGPVASGKTTVARMVASELSWIYLSSGMLYRALAYVLVTNYHATEKMLEAPDPSLVDKICAGLDYRYAPTTGAKMCYQGNDLSSLLKTAAVDRAASLVSADSHVRTQIVTLQKRIASGYDVIADGRDCGTVVFPQAVLKIFLTAPLEVRARRWQADQARQGNIQDLETCKAAVVERDARDTDRVHSPLVVATGAWCLDTSHYTPEGLAQIIVTRIVGMKEA